MGGQRVLKTKPSCLWRQEGASDSSPPFDPSWEVGKLAFQPQNSWRLAVSASQEIQLRPFGRHDPWDRFPTELLWSHWGRISKSGGDCMGLRWGGQGLTCEARMEGWMGLRFPVAKPGTPPLHPRTPIPFEDLWGQVGGVPKHPTSLLRPSWKYMDPETDAGPMHRCSDFWSTFPLCLLPSQLNLPSPARPVHPPPPPVSEASWGREGARVGPAEGA